MQPPDPFEILVDPISGGRKADAQKLRWDLMPTGPIQEVVEILTLGVTKYDERNWEKGMLWHRPYAAAMRHLWAWWGGEDRDPESGKSHLAHAACNILFLLEYTKTCKTYDDRPTTLRKQL
jgi:hypothetical protein